MILQLNGLTSALLNAHLHGPAPLGIATSSIPYDLSSDIRGRNGSSWNIYTILKVKEREKKEKERYKTEEKKKRVQLKILK